MNKPHEGGLATYSADHLECRGGLGHAWEWITDWKLVWNHDHTKLLEYERLARCTRCKTLRKKKYDGQTGYVVKGGRYDYADGYKLKSPDGSRFDPAEARMEIIRRTGII